MKHTHLVKGLDYVLKQKVRGAIVAWEEKGKEGEGGRYTRTHTRAHNTHAHTRTHTHTLVVVCTGTHGRELLVILSLVPA